MTRRTDSATARVIKVVYFDEESASDYLDITAGGKESATAENVAERTREAHSEVEARLIAKLSWLPFLGASAEADAGAGLSASGRSILSKTLSNTILTDYLAKAEGEDRLHQLRDLQVTAPWNSLAFMKMFAPYMIAMKSDESGFDLSRLDEALAGAKGYYELLGEHTETHVKSVLRFNIEAFRNNYGLTDLRRMNLVFHGVRVGKTTEDSLSMAAEMSQDEPALEVTGADLVNRSPLENTNLIDVFDVILAGVER